MKRNAYTLIEMIMAIALIGIVGGIVSGMLGKVYENYAQQQEMSKLEFSSIQALNQIENYLKRSIPQSILMHNGTSVAGNLDVYNPNAYTPLRNIQNGDLTANKTLLWLDIDKESLQGTGPQPFYNQWLNIRTSTGNQIASVGSQFNNIVQTQRNIFGTATASPAIYFVYGNQQGSPYEKFYNETPATQSTAIFPIDQVAPINANDFTLTRIPPEIGEIFYVTGTGYALQLNGNILSLVYNFQPWEIIGAGFGAGNGETFLNGQSQPILENVTSFDYWVEFDTLRIKICVESREVIDIDSAGNNVRASICKERAIGVI